MTVNANDNERLLVSGVRRGDTAAMKAVYKLHIRYLTAVCSRYIVNPEDVKDVLQESFMKIFSSIDTFEYRGEGSLKGWLTKIVINETLRFIRRNSRFDFQEITEAEASIPYEDPRLDDMDAEVIYRLIRELPDGYRTIFNLFVIEGKSHKEISEMLNIKVNTSASQLFRAKAMLAMRIKQYQK